MRLALLAAASLVWALPAASQQSRTLNIGMAGIPTGMDPHYHSSNNNNAQLRQIFTNLERLLADNDVDRTQIARTTVFLVDMADYAMLNEVYLEWFGEHRPARSAIAVAELPFGARVEIEAWAYLGDGAVGGQ